MWQRRVPKRDRNGIPILPKHAPPFDLAPLKSIFKQCHGKVRHRDRESARIHAKETDKKVYCCPWCNFFHVGESADTRVTSVHIPAKKK